MLPGDKKDKGSDPVSVVSQKPRHSYGPSCLSLDPSGPLSICFPTVHLKASWARSSKGAPSTHGAAAHLAVHGTSLRGPGGQALEALKYTRPRLSEGRTWLRKEAPGQMGDEPLTALHRPWPAIPLLPLLQYPLHSLGHLPFSSLSTWCCLSQDYLYNLQNISKC